MPTNSQPKAPDFTAIVGQKGQVLVCIKSEGNIQQYKYLDVPDVPYKDGKTVGETISALLKRLDELEAWKRQYEPVINKTAKQTIKNTKHIVEGSDVL